VPRADNSDQYATGVLSQNLMKKAAPARRLDFFGRHGWRRPHQQSKA